MPDFEKIFSGAALSSEVCTGHGLKKGSRQGFSTGKAQGIRLAKRVMHLAGEGWPETEIAADCAVTVQEVHEILTGLP